MMKALQDTKLSMQERKIGGLEEVIHEKEQQIESLKARLHNAPHIQQQRMLQEQIEEGQRERDRLRRDLQAARDEAERERLEALDTHRRESIELRGAIEQLQKEIADRQVLIESQNEKISDMTRELHHLRQYSQRGYLERMDSTERHELDKALAELQTARNEVDKLLAMVKSLERERDGLQGRVKDLQRQLEEAKRLEHQPKGDMSSIYKMSASDQEILRVKDQRFVPGKGAFFLRGNENLRLHAVRVFRDMIELRASFATHELTWRGETRRSGGPLSRGEARPLHMRPWLTSVARPSWS